MTKAAAKVPDTADREDIKVELRRIFGAPQFNHSPVMCRLLSFLVDQTLAGDGHRMKAYTIAVDALGRDTDFDSRIDSYPRVQVGRLRKLLNDFYAENGSVADLRIRIPKGAYIVEFQEPAIVVIDHSGVGEAPVEASSEQPRPTTSNTKIADLGRFAAAAFVAALIGLFAWQALGGLARADESQSLSGVETGERNDEYRRCTKVIAAERCAEMLGR